MVNITQSEHPFGEFYSTSEVLKLLKISRTTLYEIRKTGTLRAFKLSKKKHFFKKEDIQKLFISDNTGA